MVADKTLIGAGVFASLFILERLRAAAPGHGGFSRLARNGALWLALVAISPVIVLPLTLFAADHPLWPRSPGAGGALLLAMDLALLDLWSYWLHRAYHEIGVMRRFHRVHHLDEHLDTTSAVRFHPGEVALSALLRMAPIILLAVPFNHVVIFEALLLAGSLFHHSNVRLPAAFEMAVSKVFVTPSIHWVHHHADAKDTNSNYSAVFSVWDRLFGTRSRTIRTPEMKIGLEGVADESLPGLLLAPFRNLNRGSRKL
ncbi:MAG: sterol desaturase family protein [Parvularculaceae bacterium]|nr:sterol desaturase family protein [Parvularculaceae bacterium]